MLVFVSLRRNAWTAAAPARHRSRACSYGTPDPRQGQQLVYTPTVTNNGPNTAKGTVLHT